MTEKITKQNFIRLGINTFKEHELREIVAVFCKLPGIAPQSCAPAQCAPDREQIARIINPDLYVEYDLLVEKGTLADNGKPWAWVVFGTRIERLLAKADAIIALSAVTSTDRNLAVDRDSDRSTTVPDQVKQQHAGPGGGMTSPDPTAVSSTHRGET